MIKLSKTEGKHKMKKIIAKVLLLLAITILVVGLVSAAQTNKSTDKNSKTLKNVTKTTTPNISKTKKSISIINIAKKNNLKQTNQKNKKGKSVQNIYVSSNGTGTGKKINSPTSLKKALSSVNNNGVIYLVTSSGEDTYSNDLSIKTNDNVKNGTTKFSIIGQNNKTIKLNVGLIEKLGVTFDNIIFTKGIESYTSTITVKNSNFQNLSVSYGGAAVYAENSNITITNTKFTKNTAGQMGGAIYTKKGKLNITHSTFTSNSAGSFYDGKGNAICTENTNVNIIGSIFDKNSGSGSSVVFTEGGKIKISNNEFKNGSTALINTGKLTLTNNIITDNNGEWSTGAVSTESDNAIITNNTFKNNFATHLGALENRGRNAQIKNNKFINNRAEGTGELGALLSVGDKTKIINNTFTNNYGGWYSGALYTSGDDIVIKNNIFSNNSVHDKGGAIYQTGQNTKISNNTFINNKAGTASVIYNYDGSISLTNNIIKNNNNTNSEGKLLVINETNGKITSKNNKIYIHDNKKQIIADNLQNTFFKNNYIIEETSYKSKLTLKFSSTKPSLGSKVKATITLKDNKDNVIPKQKLTVKIGSKYYTVKTNSNGIATLTYKITKIGTVKVTVNYAGTPEHQKISKKANIKVTKIKTKLTLKLSKRKVKVRNRIKITVTLKNNLNKVIKKQKVAIKIGSKIYNRKTNKKGTITLRYKVVKSAIGKSITAIYKGNYMYKNSRASKKLLKA